MPLSFVPLRGDDLSVNVALYSQNSISISKACLMLHPDVGKQVGSRETPLGPSQSPSSQVSPVSRALEKLGGREDGEDYEEPI